MRVMLDSMLMFAMHVKTASGHFPPKRNRNAKRALIIADTAHNAGHKKGRLRALQNAVVRSMWSVLHRVLIGDLFLLRRQAVIKLREVLRHGLHPV